MATQLNRDETSFAGQIRLAEPQNLAIDGITPSIALAPATAHEVGSAMREANEQRLAVIAVGGGTQMQYGTPSERYDLGLDLHGLDRVVEYAPADLTVTVEAGMRLDALQGRLAEQGQWLRFDPIERPEATIGGLLATNASGPGRIAYGTLRDLLIGIRFVTAGGEAVHSGGRVVKNVAGYDLGKLMIGSFGTLGVIVEATFKVAPLPARRRYLVVEAQNNDDGSEALAGFARRITRQSLAADGLVLSCDESGSWRLSIRLAGSVAAVERSQRDLTGLTDGCNITECDESDWDTSLREGLKEELVLRCGVVPSRIQQLLEQLSDLGMLKVTAYPTAGVAYVYGQSISALAIEAVRRASERLGGSMVIERAPPEVRTKVDVWGAPRADFALMQRIKSELDSQGILSPGRFVGGI